MVNPQLLALRDQLSELVLAKYPDAKVEFLGDALVIRYRSPEFETHLLTPFADTFPTKAEQFPADFSEFIIRVSAEDGFMATKLEQNAGAKEQTYGTLDSSVYAWNSTRLKYRVLHPTDIPMNSWVYPAIGRLSRANLFDKPLRFELGLGSDLHGSRPLTPYEVTVALARTLYIPEKNQRLNAAPQDLKGDFANLRMAFPTEYVLSLSAPDEKRDLQKQLLWLASAYGKGVDANFVADVKQIVADYAAGALAETSPVN